MKTMVMTSMLILGLAAVPGYTAIVADWQLNDATSGTTQKLATDSSGNSRSMDGTNADLGSDMYWTSGQGGGSNGAMHFNDGYNVTHYFEWNGVPTNDSFTLLSGMIQAKVYYDPAASPVGTDYILRLNGSNNSHPSYSFSIGTDKVLSFNAYCSSYGNTVSSGANLVPTNEWVELTVSWEWDPQAKSGVGAAPAKLWIGNTLVGEIADLYDQRPPTNFNWSINSAILGAMEQRHDGSGGWHHFAGDIDFITVSDAVPEPATVGLLVLGFGLLRRK